MTTTEKENIAKVIEEHGLFDEIEGAENYVLSLIRKDIKYSKPPYITLREAIQKYGDDKLLYQICNMDSVGTIEANNKDAAFPYTFRHVLISRSGKTKYYELCYFRGRKDSGFLYVATELNLNDFLDEDEFLDELINRNEIDSVYGDSITGINEIDHETYAAFVY